MKIEPLSLIEADAELCTFLRRLAKGKIRKLFPSEGIDLSKLNEYLTNGATSKTELSDGQVNKALVIRL